MNEHAETTTERVGAAGSSVRLIILDQDRELVRALSQRAATRGWDDHVLRGPATRRLLARLKIDALLVDPVALGSEPWVWLVRILAGLPNLAVVVATGSSTPDERIRGLGLGIDDWVDKPCHPDEMLERVASAVRRRRVGGQAPAPDGKRLAGELEIRVRERRVLVDGVDMQLTEREFGVLQVLAANEGIVIERGKIFARVWGYTMVAGDRSVDVHVRKLRDKLRGASPGWVYIHTQFRIGYRFQPEGRRQ
jgi:two-component system, OmpR family, response regulator VanR